MNWIQIKANVKPYNAEALEEGLSAAGASAVTMLDAEDQPILEPELGTTPLWRSTVVIGLFSADDDIESATKITRDVYKHLSGEEAPSLHKEILENEDWTRKWIENFKPLRFGDRLWVCPSWCDVPDENAVNLMLDPGLAFGTGTHPTTSLCLKWLDSVDLSNKSIVDYGCGSGVLGIAALLLGAKNLLAIDNDPQALLATHDNAARNNIDSACLQSSLPEDAPLVQSDVLLANILAQPLHELKDRMKEHLKPGGLIVMSGILEAQASGLLEHYKEDFRMNPPVIEDGWVRLSGQKR